MLRLIVPMLICTFILANSAVAAIEPSLTEITVDAGKPLGPIGDLYSFGYNGWGDIINTGMITNFNDINTKYCRLNVNLTGLCGDKPGDYHWDATGPADVNMTLVDNIKTIITNGWTPLLAFTIHGGGGAMPKWFHGDANDHKQNSWCRYNTDGSKVSDGYGNQLDAMTQITRDITAYLVSKGFVGQSYETIYEMGVDMPLVEIHYAVAKGVREADPAAILIGPATWPQWSVEERFVKPYLKKYGADLLDMVSMHWYGTNDHGYVELMKNNNDDILTMADTAATKYLMEKTTMFRDATSSLSVLLSDKTLNPSGKKIGITFTEIDIDATSYYQRNPVNNDWPKYRADTDCWLNCNYFGGVWWASVLSNIASTGKGADAFKFNGRNYYGMQDMTGDNKAYRYPIWFAFKLLQDQGGLIKGRQVVSAAAKGGGAPMVEAFATGGPDDLRVIVVNKSSDQQAADISISGMKSGHWTATRYLYDRTRVASCMGREPGHNGSAKFEGYPDSDAVSKKCLTPVNSVACRSEGGKVTITNMPCPPISFTVLTFNKGQ
ncbi:MAG: hypothetical protein ABFD54_07325 [Armatimonadota bacterium]|nr:glycoside hydrolase family 44 protein [bacterium]